MYTVLACRVSHSVGYRRLASRCPKNLGLTLVYMPCSLDGC